jgi:16S rRNA (guanine527-N7)-methyltransferase
VTELPAALFQSPLPGIRRPLSRPEGQKLINYLKLLRKWQKTHRLIGSDDPAWILENVFVHSLCFLEALPSESRVIADVGSGAGLPGVPIAIVRPDLDLTLVEAKQRRVSFLSTVVRELSLDATRVLGERVEDLGENYASRFDAVVMRCAGGGSSRVLAEASRILRPGGVVVVSAHSSSSLPAGAEAIVVRAPSGARWTFHRVVKRFGS